jgi:hypothetical protein
VQGLLIRPRPGRPAKVTGKVARHLDRLVDQDLLQHGASRSQWSCRELATVLACQTGVQLSRESVREVLKKDLSGHHPTGRLTPDPAELAWASLDLAALGYRACRGELIVLYEDEAILWRFALPRVGWGHGKAQPLSHRQIRLEEHLKRHAWGRYRSWSCVASGVLLSVIGAV